jgi:hypothetical protein
MVAAHYISCDPRASHGNQITVLMMALNCRSMDKSPDNVSKEKTISVLACL